jgi:hypothetical protein
MSSPTHDHPGNGRATMQAVIVERLEALRAELMKGEARLRQLDEERGALRDQLLRIDGAITALTQLCEQPGVVAGESAESIATDRELAGQA